MNLNRLLSRSEDFWGTFDSLMIADIIRILFDYLLDANECAKLLFLSKRYYYPVWSVYSNYVFTLTCVEHRSGKLPEKILDILDNLDVSQSHNILNFPLNIMTSPSIPMRYKYMMNDFMHFNIIGACIPFVRSVVNIVDGKIDRENIDLSLNEEKMVLHYTKRISQSTNDLFDDMKDLYTKILSGTPNKMTIIEEVFNSLSGGVGKDITQLISTCYIQSLENINNKLFDKIKNLCGDKKIHGCTRIVFPNGTTFKYSTDTPNLKISSTIEYNIEKFPIDGQIYYGLLETETCIRHECKCISRDCVKHCFNDKKILETKETKDCIKFIRF